MPSTSTLTKLSHIYLNEVSDIGYYLIWLQEVGKNFRVDNQRKRSARDKKTEVTYGQRQIF